MDGCYVDSSIIEDEQLTDNCRPTLTKLLIRELSRNPEYNSLHRHMYKRVLVSLSDRTAMKEYKRLDTSSKVRNVD